MVCVYVQERQERRTRLKVILKSEVACGQLKETISSGYSRTLALRKYLLHLAARLWRRKELPGGFLSLSGTSSQTLPLKYDPVPGAFQSIWSAHTAGEQPAVRRAPRLNLAPVNLELGYPPGA